MTKVTPFIKWAGGKSQLIKTFQNFYPEQLTKGRIKQYVEPFLGSAAVFLDVVQKYKIQTAVLGDINEELILAYEVIQKNVDELIEFLERYKKNYLKQTPERRKEYFYEIRSTYNQQRFNIDYDHYAENWIPRAAQLIFMNKTCYNGLFRMNSKGEFNSPSGSYKNPKIHDEKNIRKLSKLLRIAEIRRLHFSDIKPLVKSDSFVYFDPPYRPLSKTANFTSYSTFQFGDEQQIELARLYKALDKKSGKLMLSNSDPKNSDPNDDFFDRLYEPFHLHRVKANRIINSDKTKRGQISEILVTNYEVKTS